MLIHRHLARGGETRDIARRDGSIVDHDARRLDPGLGGLARDVIQRRGSYFRQGRDIVEQCQQTYTHDSILAEE